MRCAGEARPVLAVLGWGPGRPLFSAGPALGLLLFAPGQPCICSRQRSLGPCGVQELKVLSGADNSSCLFRGHHLVRGERLLPCDSSETLSKWAQPLQRSSDLSPSLDHRAGMGVGSTHQGVALPCALPGGDPSPRAGQARPHFLGRGQGGAVGGDDLTQWD